MLQRAHQEVLRILYLQISLFVSCPSVRLSLLQENVHGIGCKMRDVAVFPPSFPKPFHWLVIRNDWMIFLCVSSPVCFAYQQAADVTGFPPPMTKERWNVTSMYRTHPFFRINRSCYSLSTQSFLLLLFFARFRLKSDIFSLQFSFIS